MAKKIWSKQDESYLVKNYSNTDFMEMINKLGKSKSQIQSKARILGLKRNRTIQNMHRAITLKKIITNENGDILKECKNCKKYLLQNNFYKHNETFDKLSNECKQCKKNRMVKFVQSNSEKVKKYQKQYREKNKEKLREYSLTYQRTSPKAKIIRKKYTENNKDRIKARNKIYSQTAIAKEKKRMSQQKRRTKKKQLPCTLTIQQWENTKLYWTNKNNQLTCAYCSIVTEKVQQDHIIPLSKNGGFTKDNIIPACASCNLSKNNKNIDDYFLYSNSFKKDNYLKILDFIKINSNWGEG